MLCKNFNELSDLLRDGGTGILNRVELFSRFSEISADILLSSEDIEYILLHFTNCQICLRAIGDTDEIQVTPIPHWNVNGVMDISDSPPWNKVVGKQLYRAWRLVNDGGYNDGLQLGFGQKEIRLQVETAASRINYKLLITQYAE